MRLLGVDHGSKRIGLAVSDPDGRVALPMTVMARTGRSDAIEIVELARREGAERIVVGLPLSSDGSRGPQATVALRFGERLAAAAGDIPVVFWDERFSTAEANRRMIDAGLSRASRDKIRDAAAAAVMLQDYLDSNPETRQGST
jgi:putative pre-16S rRNA nuclease